MNIVWGLLFFVCGLWILLLRHRANVTDLEMRQVQKRVAECFRTVRLDAVEVKVLEKEIQKLRTKIRTLEPK